MTATWRPSQLNLHVDFSSSSDVAFSVAREDLSLSAQRYDPLAQAVINGRSDLFELMEHEFAQKKRTRERLDLGNVGNYRVTKKESEFVPVGRGSLRAPRVIWYTPTKQLGGEWVFFQSRQRSVIWMITWGALAGYDECVFRQVLALFRWLDEAFFRSLPA